MRLNSSVAEYEDKLGRPYIRVAGFQIWVHGRQFPDSNDYWDGNWINITAYCGAKGVDAWASGPIIHLPEIKRWADACEEMNETLSGEAILDCMEPELSVELRMKEAGHISMLVSITPDHLTQEHTFQFEIDQTYLTELVSDCRRVLADYPIRNEPE